MITNQHKSICKTFDIEAWLSNGVIFSNIPQQVRVGWGKLKWHPGPLQGQSPQYYFPDYFGRNTQPWLECEHHSIINTKELLALIKKNSVSLNEPFKWRQPDKKIFTEGFNLSKMLMNETGLIKTVPYVFIRADDTMTPQHRLHALQNTITYALNAPVYIYGFWHQDEGMIGATPELLFKQQSMSGNLETMALAGTTSLDSFLGHMQNDPKLLEEHSVVVKDITEQLSCFGQVNIGLLQELVLPHLKHLYTPLTVALHGKFDFQSFLEALHPTPALGGYPRDLSIQFLKSYELSISRGRFGAPVGMWDRMTDQKLCYVAIRNVIWHKSEILIGAGCGIVKGSELEKEWDEILLKINSILRFLGI